ncbi:TPA: hypothetical protein TVG31_002006, partial [Streptococcus equi subsp. zooepidemicus]|nr:hypothetical protein [Streptococcus equi subsp. zooepidemicus]
MKKYSFLLSGLVFLMLGARTANAETVNPVTDGAKLSISKELNLAEDVLSPKTTFNFTIASDDSVVDGEQKEGLKIYKGKIDGLI